MRKIPNTQMVFIMAQVRHCSVTHKTYLDVSSLMVWLFRSPQDKWESGWPAKTEPARKQVKSTNSPKARSVKRGGALS